MHSNEDFLTYRPFQYITICSLTLTLQINQSVWFKLLFPHVMNCICSKSDHLGWYRKWFGPKKIEKTIYMGSKRVLCDWLLYGPLNFALISINECNFGCYIWPNHIWHVMWKVSLFGKITSDLSQFRSENKDMCLNFFEQLAFDCRKLFLVPVWYSGIMIFTKFSLHFSSGGVIFDAHTRNSNGSGNNDI